MGTRTQAKYTHGAIQGERRCSPPDRFSCPRPAQVDLWICLICGHVGCGRYKAGHAIDHWKASQHCYALELETQRVGLAQGRMRDVSHTLPFLMSYILDIPCA